MTKYKKLLVLPCTVILICGYIIGFNMIKRADRAAEISDAAAVANVNTNTNVNDDRQTNENSDGDADGKETADSAEEDKEEAKDAKDTDDNKNAELAAIWCAAEDARRGKKLFSLFPGYICLQITSTPGISMCLK